MQRSWMRQSSFWAVSRETEDGYQISVAPYLLKKENALAGVNDVFNAVTVCGNTLGDTMFYGRGAGKLPTASAVVADVVECARHLQKTVGCLWEEGEAKVADFDSQEGRFFVRVSKKAQTDVEKVFGDVVPGRFGQRFGGIRFCDRIHAGSRV